MMDPRLLMFAALSLASNASAALLPSGLDNAGHLAVVPALAAPAQAGFAYAPLENGVQVRCGARVKNLLFHGPSTVRVTTTLGKTHTDHPSLVVLGPPGGTTIRLEERPDSVEVSTEALRISVDKATGALSFRRTDGTLLTQEAPPTDKALQEVSISGAPTYEVRQTFRLAEDESLYGLGQYDRRYMDYRGQDVLLVQTNIGIVVPFLLSTRRYGILWDAASKSTFKDTADGATFWSESSPAGIDYYLVAGDTMDDVIAGYRRLTGAAPLFSKSAYGLFMSKERYKTQQELVDVVRRFRQDGFPLDVIVQDWQYWGGDKDGTWSGMTWNKERFPDPAGMTSTLHDELNVQLMVSIWPSIGDDTELARELDAQGLRHKPLHWISKKARIYDAFSPTARAIYFKHIKKGLLDNGVDALWMDGTEVEVGTACHDPAQVEADIKGLGNNALGDYSRTLNAYSLVTTQGTYEGQRATSDKRVLTLTRSAWNGQQRYAALSWSGDTTASWESFRNQIAGGLNVAMAGQPYWTQDTGGFFVNSPYAEGGSGTPAYRELFARWHQFGIFNPIYRIHGTSIDREPYRFRESDPEFYRSLLTAARLRYRLIPYHYGLAWRVTDSGYTPMRALPMTFPDDRAARRIDDQFLFGDAFLVHPVTRALYRTIEPPPPAIPPQFLQTPDGRPGVAVEYYQGRNFEKLASRRVDAHIDYTWPGPPLAEPPEGLTRLEDFSGRWEGFIVAAETGEHEIGIGADDGFRLWLKGTLVAEDWRSRAILYRTHRLQVQAGERVPFRIDYFQGTNTRALRLGWRTPSELARPPATIDTTVATYLPAGADWFDFWTNERHSGGRTISRDCPLDLFPLYVRAGSIVPLSPPMQHVNERPEAPYELRIYPGADARFTLYEDDGSTYAYERGERATVELRWNERARTLEIGPRQGSFPGLVPERELRVVLAADTRNAGPQEVAQPDRIVRYNGSAQTLHF